MTPTFSLAGLALSVGVAVGLGAGWSVRAWKADAEKADAARQLQDAKDKETDRANQIAGLWAANSEHLRAGAREREAKLRRELEDVRYRCPVPDAGRLLLESAVDQANAARGAGAALPGTPEAGRPDDGRPAGP